ncbi:TVP38/TMEM64 family protein [Salinibius halmophilus]|uniref:TVP38/TMEM64 family protein n=1 Tax=Salinibius halmophilus TaxID=1853216 RepID=UPI000E674A95|nr:VTT domain-containing protein [Salinibius halmophilus]
MTKTKLYRLLGAWLVIAACTFYLSTRLSQQLTFDALRNWVETYALWALIAYIVILSLRGLLFMPTMPLILLCAALAPAWLAFTATFIGTLTSAFLVTTVVAKILQSHPEAKLTHKRWRRAKAWLHRYGVSAVAGWAFFPFVFTEAIVYVAAYSGMPRKRVIVATCVGECFLIMLLIFAGQRGIQFIQQGF